MRCFGLAIGLTLVNELVEKHGSTVDASSAGSGQGSEFTVRLPAIRRTEGAAPEVPVVPPDASRQVAAAPAPAVSLRILVVDDTNGGWTLNPI